MMTGGAARASFVSQGLVLALLAAILLPFVLAGNTPDCPPRNIILVICDGMGPEHEVAAEYLMGRSATWRDAPHQASVETASTVAVTDSAAAGTAMSAGVTVDNQVIAQFIPGNSTDTETSLEYYGTVGGKRTGLVTSTYITHATPASFAAHTNNRNNLAAIYSDYVTVTKPNVIFGGGHGEVDLSMAQANGYRTASSKTEMDAFTTSDDLVIAAFGNDHMPYEFDQSGQYDLNDYPHLSEMTSKALELLSGSTATNNGFFLMVECGRIDHAGHGNNLSRNVYETQECDAAVQVLKDFVLANPSDSFLVVTSDHETGGLNSLVDNGVGIVPGGNWASAVHSDVNVNLYAYGERGSTVDGLVIENELVYDLTFVPICTASPVPTPTPPPASPSVGPPTATHTAFATPTFTPTFTPTATAPTTPTLTPTLTAVSTATTTLTSAPTPPPTSPPTATPTAIPTRSPTQSPTQSGTPSTTGAASRTPSSSRSPSASPEVCSVSISLESVAGVTQREAANPGGFLVGYNVLVTGEPGESQISATVSYNDDEQTVFLNVADFGVSLVEFEMTDEICSGSGYFLIARPNVDHSTVAAVGVALADRITLSSLDNDDTLAFIASFFALSPSLVEVKDEEAGQQIAFVISSDASEASERSEQLCLGLTGEHPYFDGTPLFQAQCAVTSDFVQFNAGTSSSSDSGNDSSNSDSDSFSRSGGSPASSRSRDSSPASSAGSLAASIGLLTAAMGAALV